MPPFIPETFYRTTPEYTKGFEEGFRAAKVAAQKRLKAALKELNELEPFPTYTATTSTSI